LLSSICSAVNEWVGGLTASRARTLQGGIRALLNDPKGRALAKNVLENPLIKTLEPPPGRFSLPGLLGLWWDRFQRPHYISSSLFVTVLLDEIAPMGNDAPPQACGDIWNALHAKLKEQTDRKTDLEKSTTELTTQAAQLAADAKVNRDSVKAKQASETAKKAEQAHQDALLADKEATAFKALIALASRSPNDLDKLRENLETWYDEAMERVSGWYKRKSQLMLIAIAASVSVAINADGVSFLQYLNQDSTARASIAAAARDFVQNPAADPRNTGGTATKPVTTATSTEAAAESQMAGAEDRVNMLNAQLRSYSIPIGWNLNNFSWKDLWASFMRDEVPTTLQPSSPASVSARTDKPQSASYFVAELRRLPATRYEWFLKALGLLFSTVAMSMGASFYFDLLNNLVNLRQTGVPPDEQKKKPQTNTA